jgi:hypothetical protein
MEKFRKAPKGAFLLAVINTNNSFYKGIKMTYAIYKQGVPATTGVKTFTTGFVASAPTAVANIIAPTVSPATGLATKLGPNSNNGTQATAIGVGIHTIR